MAFIKLKTQGEGGRTR